MVDVGELPSIASASPGPLVPENILFFLGFSWFRSLRGVIWRRVEGESMKVKDKYLRERGVKQGGRMRIRELGNEGWRRVWRK